MTTKVSGAMQSGDAGGDLLTTKGDLYGHDGAAPGRLAVGAPGTFPKADPSQPFGILWTTLPSRTVGEVFLFAGFANPPGALPCDAAAVSRSTYAALLAAITSTRGGSTTNGSPVVTGLSVTSDLFAGCPVEGVDIPAGARILSVDSASQITLTANATATGSSNLTFMPHGVGNGTSTFNTPDLRSRTPIGAGTGTLSLAILGVNTGTDEVAVQANDSLHTGAAVVYTASGTAAGGLTSGVTYYAIRISSTVIKLSASRTTAVAGTWINLTSAGTGTQALTVTLTPRVAGQVGGEERHACTIAEMPAHTHPDGIQPGGGFEEGFGPSTAATTGSTGGSGDHNNMQPYAVGRFFIYAGA